MASEFQTYDDVVGYMRLNNPGILNDVVGGNKSALRLIDCFGLMQACSTFSLTDRDGDFFSRARNFSIVLTLEAIQAYEISIGRTSPAMPWDDKE